MSEKIVKIPIAFKEWNHNMHGKGYVPCNVTDRWLQFSDTYHAETGLVFVDVMTKDGNDAPRKLCQLCLNIHDLQAELAKITPG